MNFVLSVHKEQLCSTQEKIMKKFIFGLLAMSSLQTFAYDNGCKVNIVNSYGNEKALEKVLTKHGFKIVSESSKANLTASSFIGNYSKTRCSRSGMCKVRSYEAAATNLYAQPMNSTEYIILSAGSLMEGRELLRTLVQGKASKHLFTTKKAALTKSLTNFDHALEKAQISCSLK